MKWLLVAILFVVGINAEELALAEQCDEEVCKLPDCRCSSTTIPGGLAARDTPQFVTLTFDDAVAVTNIDTYRELLRGRLNSNGCPAGATFYVSHEYTNYVLVNELYNMGLEIALHSISHQTPQTYWTEATYEDMVKEFADQVKLMSHFANIPESALKGVRIPFLQLSGNNSFHVMQDYGLEYDCSWPTIAFQAPGLWPYTLDYASTQDCVIPPCPSASIPKVWVNPMVTWVDLQGFPCSMVDACVFVPDRNDADAWFQFIVTNFERHYLGNRAPFGFYIHEWYLAAYPAVKEATIRFLDLISNLNDAFLVNTIEVVDWIKNPITIDQYRQQSCRWFMPASCSSRSCGPLTADHTEMNYWMTICSTCPRVYPWLGNPLGL